MMSFMRKRIRLCLYMSRDRTYNYRATKVTRSEWLLFLQSLICIKNIVNFDQEYITKKKFYWFKALSTIRQDSVSNLSTWDMEKKNSSNTRNTFSWLFQVCEIMISNKKTSNVLLLVKKSCVYQGKPVKIRHLYCSISLIVRSTWKVLVQFSFPF
jgi:hypothetical protein